MSNPNTKARDPILASGGSGGGSPKRADLLNGSPRTKSISGGGPSKQADTQKTSWPIPNSPYGKG